jgi:dolichol-phosphate mannosyltransferase
VGIPYQRDARAAGRSKYSLFGLWKLAWDGLVNFSTIPLLAFGYLAGLTACVALGLLCWAFLSHGLGYQVPWGWTSMMVSMLFLFSIQFTFLAILSQYISCIFLEVKGRPHYTISQTWGIETTPLSHFDLPTPGKDRP